jgi:glycosyltransferase involved in cell wall biosynthesis
MAHLLVVVPAYNEEQVISQTLVSLIQTLRTLKQHSEIVIIDDGSTDRTYKLASQHQVTILRHLLNRGLGGALGTGMAYAKQQQPDVVVTFDADGQHDPDDIKPLIKPILTGQKDVVIGSRMLDNNQDMPWERKTVNTIANLLTTMLFHHYSTDSQSGLRAFSRTAVNCINVKTDRMEVASEFFHQISKHHLRYGEIPIKTIYTDYSLSKGQDGIGTLNSLNVGLKMLLRLFRN